MHIYKWRHKNIVEFNFKHGESQFQDHISKFKRHIHSSWGRFLRHWLINQLGWLMRGREAFLKQYIMWHPETDNKDY